MVGGTQEMRALDQPAQMLVDGKIQKGYDQSNEPLANEHALLGRRKTDEILSAPTPLVRKHKP